MVTLGLYGRHTYLLSGSVEIRSTSKWLGCTTTGAGPVVGNKEVAGSVDIRVLHPSENIRVWNNNNRLPF